MQIEASHVGRLYGDLWAIRDVSLKVPVGEPLLLLGPSGGGKSTLLRLLAGLETPQDGKITVDGKPLSTAESDLRTYRRRLGFVFQEGNLFPHLNAEENITLPLIRAHGFSQKEAQAKAKELLERFRLLNRASYRPAELSGGQRQRVAIARAMGHDPEILLLDEPTSALDPEMSAEVTDALETLSQEGKTLVLASHATGFARRIGGQVAFLHDHRLTWYGPTKEFFQNPPNEGARLYLSRIYRE